MSEAWLRFEVGERTYALPLEAVIEVTRAARPRVSPGVRLEVGGVLNVRGEPLPVVDAAVLLREPACESRHALMLQRGALRVVLLVGRVARIARELPAPAVQEVDAETPLEFVRWLGAADQAVGLVDPNGLLEQATALLTEPRVHHEKGDLCPSAF